MNPDFDEILSGIAAGDTVSANDHPGKGFANVFTYGIRMGYLERAGSVPSQNSDPARGKRVNLYRRTPVTVVMSPRQRQCVWCAVPFERYQMPSGQVESWTRFQSRRHCSRECQLVERLSTSRGTRTIVARTCICCGAFKGGDAFNRSPTSTDSTCFTCRSRQGFDRSTLDQRRVRYARSVNSRVGRLTFTGAARNGYQWTGPEIELLAREDLSTKQIAEMIQRTPYAVAEQRRRLRKGDPQVLMLLSGPTRAKADA